MIRYAKDTPQYKHDCDRCIFLGREGEYDLYFCKDEPTIICRYGNDGPEYGSGITFALSPNPSRRPYLECLRRALRTEHKEKILDYLFKYEKSTIIDFILNVKIQK